MGRSIVHHGDKRVTANTHHFSDFGMGGSTTPPSSPGGGGGGDDGGCFIATAAYDTPMADQVQALCQFRDEYLLTNTFGKKLVKFYYHRSPPIADYIRTRSKLKALVRGLLKPVVWTARRVLGDE